MIEVFFLTDAAFEADPMVGYRKPKWLDPANYRKVVTLDPALNDTLLTDAEWAFSICQNRDEPWTYPACRSLMVGDVVKVDDVVLLCAPFGFSPVRFYSEGGKP